MVLGVIVGRVWPQSADSLKPLGDLFIKLVRMLVAPIIFCTVVHGIASVGEAKKVGRVAIKSLIYFELVTTIALILALLLVNLWAPGAGMHVDLKTLADTAVKAPAKAITFGQFLLNLVPGSAVGAFADGEVIPVLFFSLMFAFALLALGPKGKPLVDTIYSITQVLFKMIGFVMYVAPIGAFGAIAFTVGKFGLSSLLALGKLVSEFYVCCLLFVAIVLTPIALAAGVNILRLIRYIAAELMIVVGTSSGESVFPNYMPNCGGSVWRNPSSLSCCPQVTRLITTGRACIGPRSRCFSRRPSAFIYRLVSSSRSSRPCCSPQKAAPASPVRRSLFSRRRFRPRT